MSGLRLRPDDRFRPLADVAVRSKVKLMQLPDYESFGPDRNRVGVLTLILGMPSIIAMLDVARGHPEALSLLAMSLIFPLGWLAFVARYRVTFTDDRFVYRRWGPTVEVAYADATSIRLVPATRLQIAPVRAYLVTRDGRRFPFWFKVFPVRATARFFSVAPTER
jgi:hypothetical protein